MTNKLTTQKFIEKAIKKHGNKYNYFKLDYKNNRSKVIITCKEHGDFEQEANYHLKGGGCKKCYLKKVTKSNKDFIKEAQKIHGSTYDYSKVDYKGNKYKIIVVCSAHGDFEQQAKSHVLGFGCPKCNYEKNLWSYSDWEKTGLKSKNFDSFKVYIIRCWNDDEEFFKIGKTFKTIESRFYCNERMPYNYEVINIFEDKARKICKLENRLQRKNKKHKYTPHISFGGMNECFKKVEILW